MQSKYVLLSGIALLTIGLAGCNANDITSDSSSQSQTSPKIKEINQIQKLVTQKTQLTKQLWSLNVAQAIALNHRDFKKLNQIKRPLFETQNKLTTVTNEVNTLNHMLRHHYHHAVLDNGQVINTWMLLKTNSNDSGHQRAHVLVNKLRKLQSKQTAANEALWMDQNRITDAINHNDTNQLATLKTQYFADREKAVPIVNQIDLLIIQIGKLTTDLQQNQGIIQSNRTFGDWVLLQSMNRNNQVLNQSITPSNPNEENELMTGHGNLDDDDSPSSGHTTISDDGDTGGHTGGTTAGDDGGTTGHATGEAGGDAGGHAGGDAGGGGGHGGE